MRQAIVCRQILDGTGRPPFRTGVVVVDEGTIVGIGPVGDVDLANAQLIDAGDRTLLPGLIDSHVHTVGFHTRPGPVSAHADDIARDALDVVRGLQNLARSGIAAVRDCGYPHHAIFAVREAAESGLFPSPRLILCGRAINASGGHASDISVSADGVDAVRRAVRLECKAGADWIKLMVTGGTATPGERVSDVQFTFDEIVAAVDEAHRRSKRVCAHCSNAAGTKLAISAGVDSVEHGIELDDEAIQMMLERGTWLSAGLKCTEIEGVHRAQDRVPEFIARKAGPIYRLQMESFRRALAAGVRLSAATDSGPSYFPLDARSLARELALLAEVGLTPPEVIQIATRAGAELLGLHDSGTLEVGKRADLLVVEGDPLQDLMHLDRPWLVMLGGEVIRSPSDARPAWRGWAGGPIV